MKKNTLWVLCFAFIVIVCTSCGGGGGGSSADSPTGNRSEQNSNPGGQGSTNDVDKCQEKLKINVTENGMERSANPSEIAQQGYEIAKKCNFDEEELFLYLRKQGFE